MQITQAKGSGPHECSYLRSHSQPVSPDTSVQLGHKSGIPLDTLLQSGTLLQWLIELRETLTLLDTIKDLIKDTAEQPDEEVWQGLRCRNFCPHGIGVHLPPSMWMCSST